MTRGSEEQGQGWDEIAEDEQEAPLAGSRRGLIRAAAGGLVLAASGLFVPDWLEETEARKGALGGAKGGRRGRDHRGRHRRRTHGEKKAKQKGQDTPRGRDSILPSPVAIAVHNDRSTAVRLRGWQATCRYLNDCSKLNYDKWEMPTTWDWKELPGRTGDQHGQTEFVSARHYIAVQFGDTRVVEWENPSGTPMRATIRSGGWGDHGAVGGERLISRYLSLNESISADGIEAAFVGKAASGHLVLSVHLT